jgi:60S ribosome subunit biogenesis protein NIP7
MYRELEREERTELNRFFNKWGLFEYFKGRHLVVKDERVREVYMMTELAKDLALRCEPSMAGLKICEMRKHISPTLEGADIFARNSERRKVAVTEQAEALVLYGRDVFGQSIVKHTNDFGENEIIIITNLHGDAIGIGRSRFDAERVQKDGVTIDNLTDRGHYLREEDIFELE